MDDNHTLQSELYETESHIEPCENNTSNDDETIDDNGSEEEQSTTTGDNDDDSCTYAGEETPKDDTNPEHNEDDSDSESSTDSNHVIIETRRSSRQPQPRDLYVAEPASGRVSMFAQIATMYHNIQATISTPQYNARQGLRIFGNDDKKAIRSEMKNNLHQ